MNREEIARINALARKQKETGLSFEEKAEQELLRKKYVDSVKRNLTAQLEQITVVDENGNVIKPKKSSN